MKKIKYLLLGIVSILGIGFSFGATYTGINSMFSYIDGNSQTMAYFVGYDNGTNIIGRFGTSPFYWFYGTHLIDFNTLNGYYSQTNLHLVDLFNYNQQFFSPYGFSLSSTDTGNNIVYYFNQGNSNSLLIDRNVNYSTWDSFPIIIGSNGEYLTFSGDRQLIYNGESLNISNVNYLHYCYYGIDYNLSCVFSTDSNDLGFKFKSFITNTNGISEYDNFAVIPIHEKISGSNYNSNYFTGNITLVLSYGNYNSMQNLGIIYNLFNCYSSDPELLKTCDLNSKGYIDINPSSFFHRTYYNLMGNSTYVSTNGWGTFADIIYTGGHFYTRTNGYNNIFSSTSTSSSNGSRNCYNLSSCFGVSELSLQTDDSVENILLNQGTPSTTTNISGTTVNNLLINCLGPTYNTPDGLPPFYCNGPDGNLQNDILENCYTTLVYEGNNEISTHYFCNFGGVIEEVSFISEGSGVQITPCTGDSCGYWGTLQFEDIGGYSEEYFSGYLNGGYFFKCPFPYTNKLVIRPKLINLLDGLDVALPINCALAGYYEGTKVVSFTNSGHFVPNGPLLNGEGENRELLYKFFDLILILGGIFLLGKIFKNFN